MNSPAPVRIAHAALDAAALVAARPPTLGNANKSLVYALACPPGAVHRGTLHVSRWRAVGLPGALTAAPGTEFTAHADVFAYGPPAADALEWHLNFADLRLFVAYGSGLLAQDELQVAEHPALASLCEHLNHVGDPALRPFTRDDGVPTPYAIRGVERRCALATDPDVDADRPYGLYGHRFARARPEVVRAATRVLAPPTVSNILAMHAPPGGSGEYTPDDILDVCATAYAGFAAAVAESREAGAARTVIHTGNWGTGAYGGDRVLMALLQLLCAGAAGVDALAFHTFDAAGMASFREAEALLAREVWPRGVAGGMGAALESVHARRFRWGVSDGN